MDQEFEMGASQALSLAQKIACVGRSYGEGKPWAELWEEGKASALADAQDAMEKGRLSAPNETRVHIKLPVNSACGAVAAVVTALKEIQDAGVIRNLGAVTIEVDRLLPVVTALVSEKKPRMTAWTPAPFPIALAVCAVASWAIRKDPKQ